MLKKSYANIIAQYAEIFAENLGVFALSLFSIPIFVLSPIFFSASWPASLLVVGPFLSLMLNLLAGYWRADGSANREYYTPRNRRVALAAVVLTTLFAAGAAASLHSISASSVSPIIVSCLLLITTLLVPVFVGAGEYLRFSTD